MKIQTAIAIVLSAASVSAQAGNWAVKNGWCQTMTDNGQALVMLKNDTIGIFGQLQGCPNGPQELMGSRISVNGNMVPTSQMCNQQTGFKAVEVEGGQATTAAKKAIVSIASQEVSTLQVFGGQSPVGQTDCSPATCKTRCYWLMCGFSTISSSATGRSSRLLSGDGYENHQQAPGDDDLPPNARFTSGNVL